MGRVVKGARIEGQAYQVKAPSVPVKHAVSDAAVSFDDDPIFTQSAAPQRLEEPGVDLDAARAEAAKLIDDASSDAEGLLRDAQARALALIEEAQQRATQIEADAKREGFDQGVSDGRGAADAEMDEMLQTMRGLVEMARAERHKIVESAEPEIVRLAVAISERILNQHIAVDADAVLEMTRSAITRLVNRENVTVRVNPADIETMRRHREHLMSMNDIDNLRIIEDQRVDRGGVLLETEAGTIDAKISTQLREVRRLLAVDDPISVAPSNEPALINRPAQAS